MRGARSGSWRWRVPANGSRVISRDRSAVGALVAALAACVGAVLLVPVDGFVHRAVQEVRSCALIESIHAMDVVVRLVFGAIVTALVARHRGRAAGILVFVALIALAGAAAGEVLKTALERARPNESPGDFWGTSCPSGHVMNTTLAAVAIRMLAARLGYGGGALALVTGITGLGIVTQATYRVLNGSHWASDALGSVVLGVAWMSGVESIARRGSWRAPAVLGLVLAVAFGAFYEFAGWRVRLPSALDRPDASVATIELGSASDALSGRWSHGWKEPLGGVSWAAEREVSVSLRNDGSGRLLRLTIRPPAGFEGAEGCVRLRVTIDGRPREITLLEGWREYHFVLDEPREGPLRIRLELLDDVRAPGGTAPGLLAVHDVRLE